MDPNYKNMNKQQLLSVLSQLLKEKEEVAPVETPPKPNVEEIIEEVKKKLSTEN